MSEDDAVRADASHRAGQPSAQAPTGLGDTVTIPSAWQPIESAPKDVPILVWYDHDADPYYDPADPVRLTAYACHAEGGDYLGGAGVAIARWCEAYEESNGWESGQYWMMPAVWCAWFDGDNAEHVVNPLYWLPLPDAPAQVDRSPKGGDCLQAPSSDESPVAESHAPATSQDHP